MISGRGRAKIRAPRRGVNAENVDFETIWETLANAFNAIHEENASALSYEALYRMAYRLVLTKQGDELYKRVRHFEHTWLTTKTKLEILNSVTVSLSSFPKINDFRPAAGSSGQRRMEGENFLKAVQTKWDKHVQTINMLADVLMYLDRVYCQDQRKPNIYKLAMDLFRDSILFSSLPTSNSSTNMLSLLSNIILDQIRMERDGEVINKDPIRHCTWMLEGLSWPDAESQDQKLYNVHFEPEFIESSRQFYRDEAERLLGDSDAARYCEMVTDRLDQEQQRCTTMIMESTTPKILGVVEAELIKNKINEVIGMENGVRFMIDNGRLEDLNRVYRLERRVDRKTPEFTRAIQQRIEQMGSEVNKAASMSSQPEANVPAKDSEATAGPNRINQQTTAAIKWVGDVLDLKDKFDSILSRACERDNEIQAAITRSFSNFVNASNFTRSSEYVSLFIDDNMKRGIKDKSEAEVDAVLQKAIVLLRYVQDKDMFEGYYKKHLAKRLLMSKSLDMDVEKDMVSRMKIDCGNNFTQKLEAMFKDMDISRELTQDYKEYVNGLGTADQRPIDLGIHVLTSMTWPDMAKSSAQNERGLAVQCKLPTEIEELRKSFENHYFKKHNGRKLDWFMNLGTADISARFNRKYEVNVPTHGMIVLSLFNEHSRLSFEEIQAETNIPAAELVRTLMSLSVAPKSRLLKKEPMSREVSPTDVFSVNESFTSKFIKIKVGIIAGGNRVESDKERKATEEKVAEMRKHAVEAAIVRIMKQRKELQHQRLILETIEQLKSHFKPDVAIIKKRIDALIERDYLERIADSEPSAYKYVA